MFTILEENGNIYQLTEEEWLIVTFGGCGVCIFFLIRCSLFLGKVKTLRFLIFTLTAFYYFVQLNILTCGYFVEDFFSASFEEVRLMKLI